MDGSGAHNKTYDGYGAHFSKSRCSPGILRAGRRSEKFQHDIFHFLSSPLIDLLPLATGVFVFVACKCGDSPPSSVQLCGNKRLALGFSTEAFKALKIVSESDDPAIDVQSLSKNLLDHHCVTNDLKAYPLEQSFLIHILAR